MNSVQIHEIIVDSMAYKPWWCFDLKLYEQFSYDGFGNAITEFWTEVSIGEEFKISTK